jgi:uncharacterized membrane protein
MNLLNRFLRVKLWRLEKKAMLCRPPLLYYSETPLLHVAMATAQSFASKQGESWNKPPCVCTLHRLVEAGTGGKPKAA